MKAYVLISVRTGEVHEVVRQLKKIQAVLDASMTFGPYDAIAVIEAKDLSELGRVLVTEMQPIPGVIETLTCLAVD
ncbi:MAG: Lrp/AsnC ligand binding domain-containing protein [Anaerolineales bacterium]|nr:Lrp/AsnC ligand binding domain-containing protein [Anaerolineales bacterium]